MTDQPTPVPTIDIDVDGQLYTEVREIEVSETGVLMVTDNQGWAAFLAPGSWGKAVRRDTAPAPDVPGGNPGNLA